MLLYAVDFDSNDAPVAVRYIPRDEVARRTHRPSAVARRRFYVRTYPPAWRITGSPANLLSLAAAVQHGAEELVASRLGLGSGALVFGGAS